MFKQDTDGWNGNSIEFEVGVISKTTTLFDVKRVIKILNKTIKIESKQLTLLSPLSHSLIMVCLS